MNAKLVIILLALLLLVSAGVLLLREPVTTTPYADDPETPGEAAVPRPGGAGGDLGSQHPAAQRTDDLLPGESPGNGGQQPTSAGWSGDSGNPLAPRDEAATDTLPQNPTGEHRPRSAEDAAALRSILGNPSSTTMQQLGPPSATNDSGLAGTGNGAGNSTCGTDSSGDGPVIFGPPAPEAGVPQNPGLPPEAGVDQTPGMPPEGTLRPLDWQHGEAGRLIYDCEPVQLLGGGLCK